MAPATNTKAVFVTIDSQSTKDIDDALSITKTPTGFLVLIAIADPTKSVKPGSDLDDRAREMAATIYTRDFAKVSMLPKRITQESGSLVAGEIRPSFMFSIELNDQLQVNSFVPSMQKITVAHRLSYEDIPLIAADPSHVLYQQIKESVVLGQALLEGRRSKGALALYDLNQCLMTDEEGNLVKIKSREDTIGHILVQEMMILTNTLLGQYLVKHNIPAIYRNHEASVAAPPTHELRQTIESILLSPGDLEGMATNKLHALLGRAKYESVVRGHYGLNLPVYTHGTSPLRRYSDLVNLRQLKAHLNEKPFVYDKAQLTTIAEHLNVVMLERKEASTAHFKSVVAKQADQLLTSGRLSKMDNTLLAMAIKNVMGNVGVHGLLAQEISKRLANNTAADSVTNRLFFEVDRDAIDDALAADMTKWLFAYPMKSVQLCNYGISVGYVASLEFDNGTDASGFTAKATLSLTSEQTFVGVGAGNKKKLAEQFALCAALVDARDLPMPPRSAAKAALDVVVGKVAPTLGFNAKGALLELCSKHKTQAPAFEIESKGPSHKPAFRCSAKMTFKSRQLQAISPLSETKKSAEAHAAHQLLEDAKNLLKAPATDAKAKVSMNPVGDLQEFTLKNGLPMPEYTFNQITQTPPLFECEVKVIFGPGVSRTAKAASKANSKKMAASLALLDL